MGGYVAFNFLNRYPQKVSSLILCDTTFSNDSDEKQKARYRLIKKINSKGSAALVDEMLPNLLSENSLHDNKQLVDQLSNEFINVIPQSAVAALRGMAHRNNHQKLLKMIDFPTLLLFGENDNITNLETARNMKEQIKGAELKIIEEAGHYSNLENPVKFNFYLQNFLKSL
jgi:pimeloyl-ACP methyl ester carboxylesterase